MITVLNKYQEGDSIITEYTTDGKTVSHSIKSIISKNTEDPNEQEYQHDPEEIQTQTYLNTEYLVSMSEL